MLYLLKPFAQCVQIVIEVFSTDSSESKGVLADDKPRQDLYLHHRPFISLSSALGGRASIPLTPTCPIVLGSSQGVPRGAYFVLVMSHTPPAAPSIASGNPVGAGHSHPSPKTPQNSLEPSVLAVRDNREHAKACPVSHRVGGDGATLGPVALSGFRADPAL